jgi:hypothetical protein
MTRSISFIAADDRIELAALRASSVRSRPKLSSAGVLLFAVPRRAPVSGPPDGGPPIDGGSCGSDCGGASSLFDAGAEEVEDLLADLLELEAEVHEHLRGDAVVLARAGRAGGARCRRSCG